jgi:hypothetical protein
MAKRDEIFPSKYLKASDLNGKPVTVTIESATLEALKTLDGKEQTKTVLSFRGAKKLLPLNVTNWDSVADVTGEDDSDDWRGHSIELYATTTTMGGKVMDCIRIRAPEQRELKAKPTPTQKPLPDDDMNDDIPF